MTIFSRGQITSFTDALAQALYDVAVEKDREVLFLYDADVVYRMIFGAAATQRGHVTAADELVEALLSEGFVGRVHLLRPHALELSASIRRDAVRDGGHGVVSHDAVRLKFIRERNVTEAVDQLLEASRAGVTKDFLDVLREYGAAAFVAIELAHGVWQERLRRVGNKVVSFVGVGAAMRDLLEEPDTWRVFHKIDQRRRDRNVPANNLTDAAAIIALRRLVKARESDSREPEVRFYTTTASLLSTLRDRDLADVRRGLSYALGSEWQLERSRGAGSVFRSTEYFMVRSSFAAIGFGGYDSSAQLSGITVKDLQRVLRALHSVILLTGGSSDKELLEVVETMKVGDRSLLDVLREIEHVSFLDRLFGDASRIPASFEEFVREFDEVFRFLQSGEPRKQIRAEIARDTQLLAPVLWAADEERATVLVWVGVVKAIRDRVRWLVENARHGGEFISAVPARDLGLVRWSSERQPYDSGQSGEWLEMLFIGDEDVLRRVCNEIAASFVDVTSEATCMDVAAVLWALSKFDMVVEVINRFVGPSASNLIPLPLQLMRTAARVRAKLSFSTAERLDHMKELERQVKASGDAGHFLGLAYVAYALALESGERAPLLAMQKGRDGSEGAPTWGKMSFEYGALAVEKATTRLLRAFAVNHCAYVGAMAGVDDVRVAEFVAELGGIARSDAVWNYRFADTLACIALWEADGVWVRVQRGEAGALLENVCGLLDTARREIEQAHPNFGDAQVLEHEDAIRKLCLQTGCQTQ